MKTKKTPDSKKAMIEPFYIRIPSNFIDWFVKKGQSIKLRFLTYIKSKETWKLWRNRAIVVGIILLISLSFKVKDALNLYPYSEEDYLLTNDLEERTQLTTYTGGSGAARIEQLFDNVKSRSDDSLRMVATVLGYRVTEDIEYDAESGKITVTVDNRKNKRENKEDRVKKEIVYTGTKIERTSDSKVKYYLTAPDQVDFLILVVDLEAYVQSGGGRN